MRQELLELQGGAEESTVVVDLNTLPQSWADPVGRE